MSIQKNKEEKALNSELPQIPEKLYFTIGEVGRLCDLKPHVLRYWEQEFSQLSPSKRRGNRRYYQRKDVLLIRKIKELLYSQGYTIEGARQQLNGESSQKVEEIAQPHVDTRRIISNLEKVLDDLA